MYLVKKYYISEWKHNEPLSTRELLKVTHPFYDFSDEKVRYIIVEVAYWRKANAIHKWFVENVQDGVDNCDEYFVSRGNLRELLDTCKSALLSENPEDELPTQEGFFFGDTSYNDWYRSDLRYTIEVLEKELAKNSSISHHYYYQSSW